MTITIDLTAADLRRLAEAEASIGRDRLYGVLDGFFARQALLAAGQISKDIRSGKRGIKSRKGDLARSIAGLAVRIDGVPAVQVGVFRGPALPYALAQEQGTNGKNPDSPVDTITPKRAKALAIPLSPVMTPAGVHRYNSPRDVPGLQFNPPAGGRSMGNLIGFLTLESGQAAYMLLRKVDLSPKRYLRDGFAEFLPGLAERIGKLLQKIAFTGKAPS